MRARGRTSGVGSGQRSHTSGLRCEGMSRLMIRWSGSEAVWLRCCAGPGVGLEVLARWGADLALGLAPAHGAGMAHGNSAPRWCASTPTHGGVGGFSHRAGNRIRPGCIRAELAHAEARRRGGCLRVGCAAAPVWWAMAAGLSAVGGDGPTRSRSAPERAQGHPATSIRDSRRRLRRTRSSADLRATAPGKLGRTGAPDWCRRVAVVRLLGGVAWLVVRPMLLTDLGGSDRRFAHRGSCAFVMPMPCNASGRRGSTRQGPAVGLLVLSGPTRYRAWVTAT